MKRDNVLKYSYLLILVIYPILALRQANITFVNLSVIMRSLGLALLLAALVCVLLRWLFKDWHKASIMTALGMMLFFSYGHFYLWAAEKPFGPLRHRTLIITAILILVTAAVFLIRQKTMNGLVHFLNTSGTVLLSLVLVQSAVYAFQVRQASNAARESRTQTVVSDPANELPDIYLIILDSYSRSDVLDEYYDYDNSAFISSLEEMGFYIAECSQSNYPVTNLSLISLMNMDYFYNLFDEAQVIPSMRNSTVSETLRSLGYTVVGFENWVGGHFDLMEDVHLSGNSIMLANVALDGGINEFEAMLIETSFLRIFIDMPQLLPAFITGGVQGAEFYEHFQQTHFILDELKNLPALPGPKFVLAHILTPHAPYIFYPDGSYKPPKGQDPAIGYRNNVIFIDNFLVETLQSIIDNSEIPPVIILQGDHGPRDGENTREARMAILNAYYLGGKTEDLLYPTISPVNSFRIIFNAYFDTQYPLLEDHSYYLTTPKQMLNQEPEIINLCQPED